MKVDIEAAISYSAPGLEILIEGGFGNDERTCDSKEGGNQLRFYGKAVIQTDMADESSALSLSISARYTCPAGAGKALQVDSPIRFTLG